LAQWAPFTLALVGYFALIIPHATAAEMTPLSANLSLGDSAAIAKELNREGASLPQVRGQGDVIVVRKDSVARLRTRGESLPPTAFGSIKSAVCRPCRTPLWPQTGFRGTVAVERDLILETL
jgi:hypothetical protein